MKKNNYLLLAMIAAVVLLLSGCQLALEDVTASNDRFVGLNVVLMKEWSEYTESRLEPHEPDGYLLAIFHDFDNDGALLTDSQIDDHFVDIHLGYKHSTDGDLSDEDPANSAISYSISGTLYVYEQMLPEEPILSLENVYQRSDGTLYAVEENSMGKYTGNLNGLTLSVSQDSRIKSGAQEISESVFAELNVKAVIPASSIELIEMDANNVELRRQTLGESADIAVSSAAAWVLLEEHLIDGSVRRTAINLLPSEASATVFLPDDSGVCIPFTYDLKIP
ncbi:MAG: hypothetical protein J1E43_07690 [Christensenellaceae bacterium]|nr:hypothetical protein [Christensenellaceae bacterium]